MLNVTLSQEAAAEAVEPAHRAPGAGNPGHRRSPARAAEAPLTCGSVRTSAQLAQPSPLPFCCWRILAPGANRAHPGFAVTLASSKPGFGVALASGSRRTMIHFPEATFRGGQVVVLGDASHARAR